MKLLIVDDERALCETLGDILQDKGFSVAFSLCAHDAIDLMNVEQFDVGFVDIKLPDGDGLVVLHKFKERFPDSVCIIITGYASLQNVIVAMKDGADGYFIKPLNIDEVLLAIQSAFERGRMHREIRESEARYRIITENSSDLIFIVQGDGIIEYVNASALSKYLGYKPNDIIGFSLTNILLEEDNEKMIQLLSTCVTKGRGKLELRFVDKTTKSNLWFEVVGQQFTGNRDIAKFLLTCHETTARKKYEALLEEENARLQELTDLQNDFVSNATHELRTPLFLVSGAVDFLLDNYKQELPQKVMQMIESIAHGSIRFKELIELLVDFSDASADSLEIKKRSENLVIVINNIVKDLKTQIALSNINMILDLPDKLTFDFDPERIYQIIKHLIINAIKNSKEGGTIRIFVSVQDSMVLCAIQDDGIGFTNEEKVTIFKKFGKIFRQKSDYHINIQGFGLGLYLAKKIVEKHGGTIWMDSDGRNKGSVFTFSLPHHIMAK